MEIETEARRLAELEIAKKRIELEVEIERKKLELVNLLLEQRRAAKELERLEKKKSG